MEPRDLSPWVVFAAIGSVVAICIALGLLLTGGESRDSVAIGLRALFRGKPVEVYRVVDRDQDCPLVARDTADLEDGAVELEASRGFGCIVAAESETFERHAVVRDTLGTSSTSSGEAESSVWSSRARSPSGHVGRRVVISALPEAGIPDAYLPDPAVASSILWAADTRVRTRAAGVLLVIPEDLSQDQDLVEQKRRDLEALAHGWEVDVVSALGTEHRSLETYRVVVVDFDVGPGALGGQIRDTPSGVVSWSSAQWADWGLEATTVNVKGERAIVEITRPEAALTAGIYGPLPEVTEEVRRNATSWLIAIGIALFSLLIVGMAGIWSVGKRMKGLVSEQVRESKGRLSEALSSDLDFEMLRYGLWNYAWIWASVAALCIGAVAFLIAYVNLTSNEPVSGVLWNRNYGNLLGGMAWIAVGVCAGALGRWFFALRRYERTKRVYVVPSVEGGVPDSKAQDKTLNPNDSQPAPGDRLAEIGICFSGGGIRSAAYALGALQALQRDEEWWSRVADISAVSGGSYMASAHAIAQRTFDKEQTEQLKQAEKQAADADRIGNRKPYAPGSLEERHLRNHTNYLAPTFFDKLRAAGEWFGGLLFNLVVVGALLWLVAGAAALLVRSAAVAPQLSLLTSSKSPSVVLGADVAPMMRDALFGSIVILTIAGVASSLAPNSDFKAISRRFAEIFAWVGFGLFTLLFLVPAASVLWDWLVDAASTVPIVSASIAGLAIGGWLLAVLKSVLAQQQANVMAALAGVIVPLVGVFFMSWAGWVQVKMPAGLFWFCAACSVVVLAIAMMIPTIRPSMYPLYQRRLKGTFAWVSGEPRTVELADLAGQRPQLTVCAAANYSPSPIAPPGRSALPYAFSADTSGLESDGSGKPYRVESKTLSELFKKEKLLGPVFTKLWRQEQRHVGLEVIDASAISGAAVSPTMGKRTMALYRALLAMLNIRLGAWIPNPLLSHVWDSVDPGSGEWEPNSDSKRFAKAPRHLPWFVKEALGQHEPTADFTYLTDGGHYDNLGLLTLLRMGHRRIMCFDAGGEDIDRFTSLAQAMMLAEAELNIQMTFSPTPDLWPPVASDKPSPDARPMGRLRRASAADKYPEVAKDHTVVEVTFPNEPRKGVVIYCKTTVTVDSAWSVKDYRLRNPNFPNIPTLRQLYDDERFEAYRELGEAAGPSAASALHEWERLWGSDA